MTSTTSNTSAAGTEGHLAHRPGIILAIIVSCQMMFVVDTTAMTVALPQIQSDLGFSATGLSWVLNAYVLAYGGLLLLGGRTGDIFGRRSTFMAGVLLFTVCSLLGGFAVDDWQLLAARAAQGVGAAFAAPGAMSLLVTNFEEGNARNKALAVYSTLAGLGMALGMILSGILTEWASWRWVLFVNVPIGVAAVVLTPKYIAAPEKRPARVDIVGAFTATAGLTALVYGLIRGESEGWTDAVAVGSLAGAAILLGVFLVTQFRVPNPIMPMRLFADRARSAGYAAMLLVLACNFSVFYFVPQFLQEVLGFTALRAGIGFLPMGVAMFAMSRTTPRLLPRFGPRRLIISGIVLILAGVGWLAQLGADASYASGPLFPLLLVGVGIGTFLMPLTALILGGVEPRDSGIAAGILQTMQQVGGALGLAVLVTVYDAGAGGAPASRSATADGISDALLVGTGFIVVALILVTAVIKAKPRG
ncbi:MFS transporter [Streptomyces cocklensis]|uniref:Cephamycin export protein CmcT n=1 Tax=Actinacidiphila cocklensis TaxID=887465 RepID=A0A9W4GXN9_9ACTN|nr:MFS transporter [Actinacidiphila cocklensis]MDD1058823.1 MFS transporter [Actinacidiphila cocklensis]WSX74977.1 MFS transporter [Streptomyces sp. NBC_00899]CAG6398950.1 Cephamycin export protein CmcT [Actinacidiphila cocklensis]